MTVLVPKTSEPEKKNTDVESAIPEGEEELKVEIPSTNDDGKKLGEKKEEEPSELDICARRAKRRKSVMLFFMWFICLEINKILRGTLLENCGGVKLTMIQVFVITFYSWIYTCCKRKTIENNHLKIDWLYYWRFIASVGFFMFARTLIDPYGFDWKTPMGDTPSISIEAVMPFCILLASKVVLAHEIPWGQILPLGLIGCLIYVLFWRSYLDYRALLAFAVLLSLETVFSKKVLEEKRLHPVVLLVRLGCVFLCFLTPLYIYNIVDAITRYNPANELSTQVMLLYGAGLTIYSITCWGQTVAAFTVLSMYSPYEYSVGSLFLHVLSQTWIGIIGLFVFLIQTILGYRHF